jgi:hypothetical protein
MPQTKTYESATDDLPIGRWCAGCHGQFHAFGAQDEMFLVDNGGDLNHLTLTASTNPWLRHPTNVFIPNAGEYSAGAGGVLDGNAIYNPETGIPLARSNYINSRTANVELGDQVMCLSCHKAHGSQYENALRFNYALNDAHSGLGRDNGCFFCHRAKDS